MKGLLSVAENCSLRSSLKTKNLSPQATRRGVKLKTVVLVAVFLFAAFPAWAGVDKESIRPKLAKISIPFIENQGQIKDSSVKYYANTFAGNVFVNDKGEIVYSLMSKDSGQKAVIASEAKQSQKPRFFADAQNDKKEEMKGWVIKERVQGFKGSRIQGIDKAETKVNYFIGNNKEDWRSGIPSYSSVSLGEIYDGIELKLMAHGNNVEKLFIINPGADVSRIALSLEGAKSLKINESGELEIVTGLGALKFTKPYAHQEIDGKRVEVAVEYRIQNTEDRAQTVIASGAKQSQFSELIYGFEIASYNKDYPLIIDPLLSSTFIGGSNEDIGSSIVIDSVGGYVYITGSTKSPNYPVTAGAYDTTCGTDGNCNFDGSNYYYDVFVSKFDANLSTLLASTYIGGSSDDYGNSIALDRWGSNNDELYVYITGRTISPDYPTTPGAYDTTWNGAFDVFVSKLNANLSSLVASTYIGGNIEAESGLPGEGDDGGHDIAIDRWGCMIPDVNVYITGWTDSSDYPTTTDLPGAAAFDTTYNGGFIDGIVSKLNDNLSALLASTYIGGSEDDMGNSITVDRWGGNLNDLDVYITGETNSMDYPVNAYDTTWNSGFDVFVSRLDANLSNIPGNYIGTFIGGSADDGGLSIALDRWESNVDLYVTGRTGSSNYPTTPGAYDTTWNGGFDVFVSKLNAALSNLLASTFIGGSNSDWGSSIARDAGPRHIDKFCGEYIYVTGWTNSPNYPVTAGTYDTTCGTDGNCNGGFYDAFVSKLDTTLGSLIDSTFIGGSAGDGGNSVAISFAGNVYITGETSSGDYPTTPGAYDTSYNGSLDAFVSEFACYFGAIRFETVLSPGTASWEVDGVGDPFILKEGATYKMWYKGNPYWWEGQWWQDDASIGYAESTDGVNWTNRQQVHTNGSSLTDYLFTFAPSVMKEGSTYRMWHTDYYIGIGGDWSHYISYITSADGINWGNEQTVLTGSGNFSDYDDYATASQSVVKEANETYSMWYHVHQRSQVGVGGPSNIVRATSNDGINWTNKQLVLPRIPGGPEDSVGNPDVVREPDGTYTMYYVNMGAGPAIGSGITGAIYRARSTNGTTWTNRQLILTGNQLRSDITGLNTPHYFRDSDGIGYLYFSFGAPIAGSTTGYREYIGRVRLSDIVGAAGTGIGLDFGDAPDPTYPSRLASNGARHSPFTPNFYFGMGIDYEGDSRQVDADIPFDDGLTARNPITLSVANPTRLTRCVNILIDSSSDGDWQDAGEWVVQNFPVNASGNYIPNAILALPDDTWMRMTITDIPLTNYVGSSPTSFAGGETEDYIFDSQPDQFTFTDQTGVALNTLIISNSITVSGINAPASISLSICTSILCEYSVNSGAFTAASGTVNNGDTVTLRQTSSESYSTITTATLTIGGVSDTFSVTTVSPVANPLLIQITTDPASDSSPDFSPDGSKIVFVSHRSGNENIWVMKADGTNPVELTTDPARDYEPHWSPDGSQIVFKSEKGGSSNVWVMNADGTSQIQLTFDLQGYDPFSGYNGADWCPDSSKIVFDSHRTGNYDLWIMNPDGSGQTQLTTNPADDAHPSFNPDGSMVVFRSNRTGNNEIWVMNADGTGQIQLTNTSEDEGHPHFSPDGSKIVFWSLRTGNREVWIMNADGSGQTQVTNDPASDSGGSWSPDGTKIVYRSNRSGNHDIWIMTLTIPNQFTFTNETNAPLNTWVMSGTIIVSGINAPAQVSISGGSYSVNGGSFTPYSGTVNNGDSIRVMLFTSGNYSTTTSATLTIGGVSGTFSVTTMAAPAPTIYTVTPSAGLHGSISPSTPQTVAYLSTTSFTITPDPGYHFATVDGTCSGTLSGNIFTTAPITADCTVSVTFGANTSDNTVPTGNDVFVTPIPEATLTFENVTTGGIAVITENSNPSPPANFRIPSGSSYEVTFTGTFTGPVTVCFSYDPEDVHGNESNLKLMHHEVSGWVDITSPGYPDIINHVICGVTTSFSEFAIMESDPSTVSLAGGDMYVTTAGQADILCSNFICNGSINNGYKLNDASSPSAANGGALYINWGDGTPIERHDPGGSYTHNYINIGQYRVTQTVKDSNGNGSQQHWTVNVSGGTTGKGTLLISASGSAYFNISYKVMDGNTTVTTGTLAVGGSKSITLDAKTYSVKFTYQSKTPLTDPLTYHSCSTLPSGAVTSSNGSTVTVSNVTVPTGGTVSVSLNDCNN